MRPFAPAEPLANTRATRQDEWVKMTRRMLRWLGHRDFLRFGLRRRIVRCFHNPASRNPETFEVDFFGLRFPGRFDSFIDWNVFYFGCYAREELMVLRDMLAGREGAVVVDVGANVGNHTLFAALHAAEVHAIEPSPDVAARLRAAITRNRLQGVRVHEIGLGEVDAELDYSPPGTTNIGAGSFVFDFGGTSLRLPVRRGDDFVKSLGLERLDFLKIDVEGFEPEVLRGLRATILRFRPVVMCEWRPREVKMAELFPEGYRIWRLLPPRPVLGLFQRGNYRLGSGGGEDGNFLAIPDGATGLRVFEARRAGAERQGCRD